MSHFNWPQGAEAIGFLSINFDAEALDLTATTEDRLYGRYGYGRYGVSAGLPRLLKLLDRFSIPGTFFVCALDAKRHSDAVKMIVSRGHEVACRGSGMEDLPSLGDREYEMLEYATDAVEKIVGKRPSGFRAPNNAVTFDTLDHLTKLGYVYDSSFQDDDYPYRVSTASRDSIVEIPTVYALEDAPAFAARHTHARVFRTWADECDALRDVGALIPMTIHLRGDVGSTRPARLGALESVLRKLDDRGGVRYMNGEAIAMHVNHLNLPVEPNPREHDEKMLADIPFRGDLAVSNSAFKAR